ncbi:hypothetical protein [Thermotoga neapolitana]|uniref:hypothetical protein n=1 Tax=Thermotoga neapolitana TaxID=2337 RepID=UPI000AE475C2|nr:hypothetical protein [Thermotoga neapolitana]
MNELLHWKRNFFLLALGRFVSILGSSIQAVAIPLFVLDLTHSGSAVALMTVATWFRGSFSHP